MLQPLNSIPLPRWAAALVHGYIEPWILEQFIVWTWLVPMYILSLVLSLLWYQVKARALIHEQESHLSLCLPLATSHHVTARTCHAYHIRR